MGEHRDMLLGIILGLVLIVAALLAVASASAVGYALLTGFAILFAKLMKFDIKSWAIVAIVIAAMWGFAFNVQDSDLLRQGKQEIIELLSSFIR